MMKGDIWRLLSHDSLYLLETIRVKNMQEITIFSRRESGYFEVSPPPLQFYSDANQIELINRTLGIIFRSNFTLKRVSAPE